MEYTLATLLYQGKSLSTKLPLNQGSGCSAVGRAVASNTKDQWFDSSHWENFNNKKLPINYFTTKNLIKFDTGCYSQKVFYTIGPFSFCTASLSLFAAADSPSLTVAVLAA